MRGLDPRILFDGAVEKDAPVKPGQGEDWGAYFRRFPKYFRSSVAKAR